MISHTSKAPEYPEDKPPSAASVITLGGKSVANTLIQYGLWKPDGEGAVHRVAEKPFELTSDQVDFLQDLGQAILSFYKALNHLYLRKGHEWVRYWLDQGKPDWLVDLSRMNYSKQHLPLLLRPDLILSDDLMWVTELDSVPGGAGHTAALSSAFAEMGLDVISGPYAIPENFIKALDYQLGNPDWNMAIVVSDESESYRSELSYLAGVLNSKGRSAACVHPRDLFFDEDGLWLNSDGNRTRVDIVWRFFELFDLRNIPKHELVIYASKKKKVLVSPPYKPFLEEKLALGLLHHDRLEEFWEAEMGSSFEILRRCVPATWIMDPAVVPLNSEISGLRFRGRPVRDFRVLSEASQKERRLVIKPSGYSPFAWGARGVVVGHDVSQQEWAVAIENALQSFNNTPHILQEFQEGKRVEMDFYNPADGSNGKMWGRARISPYYYVTGDRAELSGVLATVCPDDKKLIHGMKDAVMTVCSLKAED